MSDWTVEKTEDFMEVRFRNDGTLWADGPVLGLLNTASHVHA